MNTNENKPSKGAIKLAFGINIAELLCGIGGIITFYNDLSIYHLFGIAILILRIFEIMLGHQITMSLIACVVGMLAVGSVWDGICIGLAFEAVISTLLAYIIVLITKLRGPVVIRNEAEEAKEETPEEIEEEKEEE